MQTKICLICGREFVKKKNCSQKEWDNKSKFCSRKCGWKFQKGKPSWNKGIHRNLNPKNNFKRGVSAVWNKYPRSEATKKKLSLAARGQHRSPSTEFKKGFISPRRGTGITKVEKSMRNWPIYREWRMKVLRRDYFKCVSCGYKSHTTVHGKSDIVVHHIKPYAQFPELRFDVNNGVTLCHPCHKRTEDYGRNKKYQSQVLIVANLCPVLIGAN